MTTTFAKIQYYRTFKFLFIRYGKKNLIAILIYQEKKKEAEGREATDRGREQEGHPGGRNRMHKGLGWG